MSALMWGVAMSALAGCAAASRQGTAEAPPHRLFIDDPAYGAFEGAPELGDRIEDAELLSVEGQRLFTDELRGAGALALIFYPGRQIVDSRPWLRRFQSRLPEFDAEGISIVAISTDPVERGKELTEELGLTFPVAVDPRLTLIRNFGVRDPSRPARALAAVLLVDAEGVVVYRKIGGRLPAPDEVLAASRGERWRCCPASCTPACDTGSPP